MFFLLKIFRFAISPSARQPGHLPMQWGLALVPGVSSKAGVLELSSPVGSMSLQPLRWDLLDTSPSVLNGKDGGSPVEFSSCTNELALQIQTLCYKQQICDNVYGWGNCLDRFGQSKMGLSLSMDYPICFSLNVSRKTCSLFFSWSQCCV